MDSYLFMAVVLLLVSTINGRVIEDLDNDIPLSNEVNDKSFRPWVSVTLTSTSKNILQVGDSVELECKVSGEPEPTIHWILGNNLNSLAGNTESSIISETSRYASADIGSRLLVKHSSVAERTFTCVGRAGGRNAYESTTMYSAPGHKSHNITELLSLNSRARKARIVFYYSYLFAAIGSNVIIPCKAAGRPIPDIEWWGPDGNVISGRDHTLRVHSSGSLYISPLDWSDVGGYISRYTCTAKNGIGEDSITTVIYAGGS